MTRTLQELEDSLDDDLAWRRVEMQALRTQIRQTQGPAQGACVRAGVAMLYAHWEGYTKHSLTEYLRFVARRRLKLAELSVGFAAMALDAEARKSQGISETRRRMHLVDRMMSGGEDRIHIPSKEVNTQSNLNSDVCDELLDLLGVDRAVFGTKAALIDYQLLRARNEIAHGRWLSIDATAYEDLHDEVMTLLTAMHNVVLEAADKKSYRRPAFSAT